MGAIADAFRGWQASERRARRLVEQRDEAREALRAEKQHGAEVSATAEKVLACLAGELHRVSSLAHARVTELEDEVERLQGELTIREQDARFHESRVEPPTEEAPW